MITVQHIRKTYLKGSVVALDDVSIEVAAGELYGLIGPDGAGKTTLFRLVATLLVADSGVATLANLDCVKDYRAIRNLIGYMPGRFSLYQDLTVEENLRFFATVFDTTIEANYHLIRDIYVQLEPFKNRRAGKLSGGMKQKLALCCALIHEPKVLLLDEPTTGVDPVSRKEFWEMLGRLREKGITILVSTPYMDEAARCDRISLIQKGKILATDTPQGISSRFGQPLFAFKSSKMHPLLIELRSWRGTATCYAFGDSHHVTLQPDATPDSALAHLATLGLTDVECEAIEPNIEDVFMALS